METFLLLSPFLLGLAGKSDSYEVNKLVYSGIKTSVTTTGTLIATVYIYFLGRYV